MDRFKTQQLFYGRFPFKIVFEKHTRIDDPQFHNGWTLHSCKQWLADNGIEYKIYSQVRYADSRRAGSIPVSITASLFLLNRADFDSCRSLYANSIVSLTEPADDSHVELLKQNETMTIRDKLYYSKYRYCVLIHRTYGDTFVDLENWLCSTFLTEKLTYTDRFRWSPYGWNPRLYVSGEDDLALVKISWSEIIKKVNVAKTWDELV